MKATKEGPIVGIALEPLKKGKGKITILLQPGRYVKIKQKKTKDKTVKSRPSKHETRFRVNFKTPKAVRPKHKKIKWSEIVKLISKSPEELAKQMSADPSVQKFIKKVIEDYRRELKQISTLIKDEKERLEKIKACKQTLKMRLKQVVKIED
jgi:hypothetical protein